MPDWDSIFRAEGHVFKNPHSDMMDLVELFEQHNVNKLLDVGCGTGRHIVYLAERGFDAFGFDSSRHAVNMARTWLKASGFRPRVKVHRMEQPFPYDDDFFDAVISIQVIHHNLTDAIRFTVKEIARVLRDEGILFVTFPILGPKPENGGWELEEIEPGTFIPHKGMEAGIPHHYFTMNEIPEVFHEFKIMEQYIDDTGHRCILARRES